MCKNCEHKGLCEGHDGAFNHLAAMGKKPSECRVAAELVLTPTTEEKPDRGATQVCRGACCDMAMCGDCD